MQFEIWLFKSEIKTPINFSIEKMGILFLSISLLICKNCFAASFNVQIFKFHFNGGLLSCKPGDSVLAVRF